MKKEKDEESGGRDTGKRREKEKGKEQEGGKERKGREKME